MLTAIAQEQKAASVLSQTFLQKYQIGASTVQGAIKILLAADFITNDQGVYEVCDKFFERYLRASTRWVENSHSFFQRNSWQLLRKF